ncbi:hypothetical protein K493DRAFT_286359 [Basidiobolus meristosporus CBS 931.73]|uniref:Uncharacterized protein n=1 Tax=Basidiobolus meristosporus CBS 931.73 TaxID=1314790 RepID=A0A1Y1Y1K3_9FUNG|nr:hypothetical protein K493DRAFT_286359 [Basidiobolus meristosporus CBS 931.73]|eukprot:ORX91829.1 hypothetical protein K493DRAFT_286359 [Basidiobolus meristosporus CBS 931.73]
MTDSSINVPVKTSAINDVFNAYGSYLNRFPLRTKAITSGVLHGLQEILSMKIAESIAKKENPQAFVGAAGEKNKPLVANYSKIWKMVLYGLILNGPINHYGYAILAKFFAGKKGRLNLALQLVVANITITPIINAVFLASMAVIAGITDPQQILNNVKRGFWGVIKKSWIISPTIQLIANKTLPLNMWVPFFNVVFFVFGTYVNSTTKLRLIRENSKKSQESE